MNSRLSMKRFQDNRISSDFSQMFGISVLLMTSSSRRSETIKVIIKNHVVHIMGWFIFVFKKLHVEISNF